jgi:hypothetical protein
MPQTGPLADALFEPQNIRWLIEYRAGTVALQTVTVIERMVKLP